MNDDISTSGSAAYVLDIPQGLVICPDGRRVLITPRQMTLLATLHANMGRPLTSRQLVRAVWGYASVDNVAVFVRNIRKRCGPDVIDTVPSWGYGVGI